MFGVRAWAFDARAVFSYRLRGHGEVSKRPAVRAVAAAAIPAAAGLSFRDRHAIIEAQGLDCLDFERASIRSLSAASLKHICNPCMEACRCRHSWKLSKTSCKIV